MGRLVSRRVFWTLGAVGVAFLALGFLFNACRAEEDLSARKAFLAYHEAVCRMDADAVRGCTPADVINL